MKTWVQSFMGWAGLVWSYQVLVPARSTVCLGMSTLSVNNDLAYPQVVASQQAPPPSNSMITLSRAPGITKKTYSVPREQTVGPPGLMTFTVPAFSDSKEGPSASTPASGP